MHCVCVAKELADWRRSALPIAVQCVVCKSLCVTQATPVTLLTNILLVTQLNICQRYLSHWFQLYLFPSLRPSQSSQATQTKPLAILTSILLFIIHLLHSFAGGFFPWRRISTWWLLAAQTNCCWKQWRVQFDSTSETHFLYIWFCWKRLHAQFHSTSESNF